MALLEVKDLKVYYSTSRGIVRAVDHASFVLERGEALGVVGESGCGKTSIALALIRLLPRNTQTYDGSILFEGLDLMKMSDEEFRRYVRWKKLSLVFQGAMNSLNPVLKVGYQVVEPALVERSMSRKDAYEKAIGLFKLLGLPPDTFHRYPHELSGGMKQRAVIAMALILSPKLLVLDEPTSALDVSVQAQIMNLLKRLKRELDLSLIFITHDIALSSDICDKLAILYAGEVVELASADDIFSAPRHPYTQLLLESIPRLRMEKKPRFIKGSPPDLIAPPSGCRFRPRCPYFFYLCKEGPPTIDIDERHVVRCWLYKKGG